MAATADLIVRVITDTSKAKGLDDTAAKTSKFSKGLAAASKVAGGALLAVGAAAIGAAKAAAEDAAGQDALAKSMERNAGATKSQIASTEDWISKMSMATGVADDDLRPALSTLVRATGDVEASQKALAVAMDVSAATGKPLGAITEAMAKGFAGTTTSLGRLVPGLSKAALKSGDMGRVMDELKAKTGGAAEAAGNTAAGKMERFKLSLQETQEAAGAVLLPALMKLTTVLVTIGNWAQQHGTLFAVIAGGVAALAVAVITLNVAMTIYTTVTTLAAAATEHAWIAALGPIGLVILAVIAVVAVIVILWKKSETFRAVVTAVWNAVRAGGLAVARVLQTVWRAVWAALSAYVRAYVVAFRVAFAVIRVVSSAIANALKAAWRAVWSFMAGMVRGFVGTFRAIFGGIREAASSVANAVKSAWAGVWGALKSAASGVGRILSAPFDAVHNAIMAVINAVESLIGALGRIHVPKISLPHIPGVNASAAVAPSGVGLTAFGAPRVPMGRASSGAVVPGGIVINVSGALDPEAVARQISRITGGHERRVGRAAS
jgi:hypothetical protein